MEIAGVRRLAHRLHRDQLDSAGKPYVDHLERVRERVADEGGGRIQEMAALLHGVPLHTETPLERLAMLGVPPRALRIVDALRRRGYEPLEKHLARVMACPGAELVKRADVADTAWYPGRRYFLLERDVETIAILDLPSLDEPDVIEGLIATVQGDPTSEWWYAVTALGHLGVREAVSPLIAAYERMEEQQRRSGASYHAYGALARILSDEDGEVLYRLLEHPDRHLRALAVGKLGALGDPGHGKALVRALTDPDDYVARLAARAVGRLRLAEAYEPLVDRLKAPTVSDAGVHQEAAAALGTIGDRRAVPHLVAALDSGWGVADHAARALVRIGDASVLPELRRRLLTAERGLEAAAWILGEFRAAEAAEDLSTTLRRSLDRPRLGQACAEALGKIGDVAAVPALVDAAASTDSLVRWGAIRALGRLQPDLVVEELIAATDDPNRNVRRQAVRALAAANDERVVPRLIGLAEGPFARDALRGLERLSDPRAALTLIHVLLTTEDREARKIAGRALAALGPAALGLEFTFIRRVVDHPPIHPTKVRRAMAWVLGQLAGIGEGGGLEGTLIRGLEDPDPLVRSRCAAGLGRQGAASSAEALERALSDPSPVVRANAATAIGKLGRDALAPALKRCLDDPHADVRDAASAALRRLRGDQGSSA